MTKPYDYVEIDPFGIYIAKCMWPGCTHNPFHRDGPDELINFLRGNLGWLVEPYALFCADHRGAVEAIRSLT